jgi:hypothetical protein
VPARAGAVDAPAAMMNLPKDIGALPGPIGEKHFAGELEDDFDTVLASVDLAAVKSVPVGVKLALRLMEPILGAMPDSTKRNLEYAVGDEGAFTRVRSSALNALVNALLYPAILLVFGVVVRGDTVFSQGTGGWILLGVLIAVAEATWRMRGDLWTRYRAIGSNPGGRQEAAQQSAQSRIRRLHLGSI